MDWYPQALLTAEQAAAGTFLLNTILKKARFGVPKPCLWLNRWLKALLLNTILKQTIQSPKKTLQSPKRQHKNLKDYTKT